MLERQKKLKLGIQYYVPNYKNNKDSIFTAKKWQLLNHIFLLLDFSCSKNKSLLLSVLPHARLLTKFVNYNENSEKL